MEHKKKTNWFLYCNLINKFCDDNYFSNFDTPDKNNALTNVINYAADKFNPHFKPFKPKYCSPAPWWDEDCRKFISERQNAL